MSEIVNGGGSDPFDHPPARPGHADIWRAIEHINRRVAALDTNVGLYIGATQRTEIAVKELGSKVDGVITTLGKEYEDDKGEKFGNGLVGRVLRIEQRHRRTIDRWLNRAIGALLVIAPMSAVIWWLVENRLGAVLR